MRWVSTIVAITLACVVAPPVVMAQSLPICRLDPPREDACAHSGPSREGAACICSTGGLALPGHIVSVPFPHARENSYSARGIRPGFPPPIESVEGPPSPLPKAAARPSASPVPNASVAAAPAPNTRPLQPARALRLGPAIPDDGVGAYGVVALAATATPDTQGRLQRLCRAFLASLPAQSSLPAAVPLADQMLTYWPVTAQSDEQCDPMLAHYDLFAGQKAIRDAAAHHTDVSDRGPYLIGWSPSTSRAVPDAIVLVMDLSSLDSERSFTDAFQFWQERVVQDPSLWRNGFSMFLVRRAARDFADHYGSDILKALHLSSE